MSGFETTYSTQGRIVFLSVGVYVVAAVLGGVAFLIGTVLFGRATGAAAGVVVAVGFALWLYGRARSTTYELYPDRIVERTRSLGGRTETEVPWREVAFAAREQSGRAKRLGVASFELVRADAEDLTVTYVPERFETELEQRLPTPAEWLEDRSGETALSATVEELARHHPRSFARGDPSAPEVGKDRDDSDGAGVDRSRTDATTGAGTDRVSVAGDPQAGVVVTESELTEVIDVDADSVDLDGLDDVDGVDSVGDIDAGDVGGGPDGSGGGGFDGGGGLDAGGDAGGGE